MLVIAAALGFSALLGAGAAVYEGRQRSVERWAAGLTGGDPHRALAVMIRNGCTACHTIPGVPGAIGSVGPALSGLADRAYIGGMLPNTADNLVLWIRDARSVNAHTAMPSTRISDSEARDVAAYLYALRR
jgi:cytochrome c1